MNVFEKIRDLIVNQIKRKKVDPNDIKEDTVLETLGLDSLDVAELVINIEEEFKISNPLQQEELMGVKCVKDIVNLVNERLK